MYNSTSSIMGETIDCRNLTLLCNFTQLTFAQAQDMTFHYVQWAQGMFDGQFDVSWSIGGRNVDGKNIMERVSRSMKSSGYWSVYLNAILKTSGIYNWKTYEEKRKQFYEHIGREKRYGSVSVDYPEYWMRLFPDGRCGNEEFLKKIYCIFSEPNRKLMTYYTAPEAYGNISVNPHLNNKSLYYGELCLSFNAHCLGEHMQTTADCMIAMLKELSNNYGNLNGHVMLQPFSVISCSSPYMRYFERFAMIDESHQKVNCREQEWYPTYYVDGVEWANVVSPLAQRHFPKTPAPTDDAIVQQLPGGGLLIQSPKAVADYDVPDAVKLKEIMCYALYPGRTKRHISWFFDEKMMNTAKDSKFMNFPRMDWAIVPVFEEELEIFANDLILWPVDVEDE